MLLKTLQDSQEKTCVYCEIFKKNLFYRTALVAVSALRNQAFRIMTLKLIATPNGPCGLSRHETLTFERVKG